MARLHKAHIYTYRTSRWPLMLRLKGTVILRIWWQVLLVGAYTTGVWAINQYSGWKINYGQNLITILGVVTGLLLVFRTNTAYDRYWEGRRLWSSMTLAIRTMSRTIWVCVKETEARDVLEKKSAINLLVAFAYATKHYLRSEYSSTHHDIAELLSPIPKYSVPSSSMPLDWRDDLPQQPLTNIQPQRQHSEGMSSIMSDDDSVKGGKKNRPTEHMSHRRHKAEALAFDFLTPTNIPIELTYYLASYVQAVSDADKLSASNFSVMATAMTTLVDSLTGFERILRTPIPLAYSIHLHHATWLYVLALPFQLVTAMGAVMIPAVMLASFTLLGILGIGYEIENPFNDDYNDLPLDDFCRVIHAEVNAMVAHTAPIPKDWIFSKDNRPLAPISDLTAEQLSTKSLEEIHALLAEPTLRRRAAAAPAATTDSNNNNTDPSGISTNPQPHHYTVDISAKDTPTAQYATFKEKV
ncbi:hypothetical protein DFQ27_001202 [Actinomortierella ambigua]|uniref:Uncharacterized protein n=1 Tax=Actinomortierella ambigua TaxID=1343610 RepID=A0A9P6QAT1_9FUNG|nr:hypothetical protein DFQ27_001202 [Actinomortierella ambigua]